VVVARAVVASVAVTAVVMAGAHVVARGVGMAAAVIVTGVVTGRIVGPVLGLSDADGAERAGAERGDRAGEDQLVAQDGHVFLLGGAANVDSLATTGSGIP
jgi:hypothetical protein